MVKSSKVYVAGADTLTGAGILFALKSQGYSHVIDEADAALNLRDYASVDFFFSKNLPEYVFLAAGKSGGIAANQKYPAELMIDNLLVTCNVVRASHKYHVKKLLYLASSCCYPRECPQPMRVEYLMTGPLEPTNQAYASAKLAGLELCTAYRTQYGSDFIGAIPANVFGRADNFSSDDSHVIGGLMRKMHEAKLAAANYVELWGTGTPQREFIFAADLGEACLFLMDNYSGASPINIGARSQRVSIKELAFLIKETVGYAGEIRFDTSRSDGMPRKILDSDPIRDLGWFPHTDFREALTATYESFLQLEHPKETSHV